MALMDFFTDPVLRAPTLGCMLMGLSSSLIGVLVFLRRRSLLGEALAHAAYPGVALSGLFFALIALQTEEAFSIAVLIGGLVTALLALFLIEFLERKLRVKSDSALCFTLSLFFGVGVLLASRLQMSHPLWYKQIQLFLYGQAATMTDIHIVLYGALAIVVVGLIVLLFRPLALIHFDRGYAEVAGLAPRFIDQLLLFLLALALVVGMRSVGIVLMSAMLIAPAAAARQFSRHLSTFFWLAGAFGIACGFLGNYFSVQIPIWAHVPRLPLATGPMIVLSATALCLLSLLFAPKRGWAVREMRLFLFRLHCQQENLMKRFYKAQKPLSSKEIHAPLHLWQMQRKGWIERADVNTYCLTESGTKRAAKLVRLHRLWEAYLVHMGQGVEKVHRSAEEMEHILTPEIERELGELLHHPKRDPHQQVIPE